MTKTVTKEQVSCDECGAETYGAKCLHCGKDYCYNCEKKLGVVEYAHAVFFRGSGDGHYCEDCDAKLTNLGKDKLHSAYRAVNLLRQEHDAWYEDFKRRMEVAEKHLTGLQK